MQKEQEQVIHILTRIDRTLYPNKTEDSEYRITEELKQAIPTCEGLKNVIESLQSRFPWSTGKLWFKIFVSLLAMLFAYFFFGFDVFTDGQYGLDNLNKFRNYSNSSTIDCAKFDEGYPDITKFCDRTNETSFELNKCTKALELSLKSLQDCKETGQRFERNPHEWLLIAISALSHVALPFLVSFAIWILIDTLRSSIFRLPIPLFTVPYEFYLNYKLYGIMARKDRNTDANTKKKFDIDIEKWKKKIEVHETIVNLSKIVESAVESGFQFFFQTVFILPSFILQETSRSWTQLVNWRTTSGKSWNFITSIWN